MGSEDERALRIALWMIRGISARAIGRVPAAAWAAAPAVDRVALSKEMGLGEAAAAALLAAPADLPGWASGLEEALRKRGGRFLLRGAPGYPDFGTLGDPPEVLSVRGELHGAGAGPMPPAVAVIGSRGADPFAVGQARRIGGALATAGFTVVSGGALGIDAAAHEGALEAGGRTVAVFGSGLLRAGPPRNRGLFARILGAGGGLCSELPPDAGSMRWHFPRRNRLVAALSRAVVVVRAAAGSGCRHTVEAAQGLGRPIFVVPAPQAGARNAYGESLLAAGTASPVAHADELLEALGLRRERPAPPGLDGEELQVLHALAEAPAGLVAIAAAAGLEPGAAARIVAGLCARGLARAAGPGRFAAGAKAAGDRADGVPVGSR